MPNLAEETTVKTDELTQKSIDYIAKLGGRKFSLSILMFLGTSVLCWFGKIHEGIFSVVCVTLVTTYIAGNVIQKKLD